MASEFSAVLRQLRHQAGMTHEQLAERAGVGVRTIRALEAGERTNLRLTTVRLLADALELSPEEREALLNAAVQRNSDRAPESAYLSGQTTHWSKTVALHRSSTSSDALVHVTEQLAQSVSSRWQRAEEQRRVLDPYLLPVRWQRAPEELTDRWANIRRLPPGGAAGLMDLSGGLDDIAEVYRRIPSGRLVVLGRSGSGKTTLAVRFVLDYLRSKVRAESVPVIFNVREWNPTTVNLRDWLTGELTRDHPYLAAPGPGVGSLAAALVGTGRVLPVLDGFDEIADGLRRPALEALNATTLPLLLTSRPSEYADAVAETAVLASAAAVELTDLTLSDLADYLPRTTREGRAGARSATAWDPVLNELRERPHSRASANLAAVLTTPLMVTLARDVYSDTSANDPAALLDTQRFASPEELEEHLLDNFTANAYRARPEYRANGRLRRGFDPERAQYWLGYLATHLSQLDTPNLEWWRLGTTMSRVSRTLLLGILTALAVGATTMLGNIAVDLISASHGLGFALERGLAVGLVAGLVSGVLYGTGSQGLAEPSRLRIRIFGSPREMGARFRYRFRRGLVFGFLVALVLELVHRIAGLGLDGGLAFALVFAPGVGLGIGLLLGLMTWLDAPIDIRSAASPTDLLKTNRRNVVCQLLIWAVLFVLIVGLVNRFAVRDRGALSAVLEVVFALGIGYGLSMTAWGRWVTLARIWLPLTGRLPWALTPFLDDACQRGVLRQAGAVYQFRHPRLQHHLGRHYRVVQFSGVRDGFQRPDRNVFRRPQRVYYRRAGGVQAHRRDQRQEARGPGSGLTARLRRWGNTRRSPGAGDARPSPSVSGAASAPGPRYEGSDLSVANTAPPNSSAEPTLVVGGGSSRTGGFGGQHHLEGEEGERRRLVAELAEHTAPGKEVPLQVQIVTGGASRGAPLRAFHVPKAGARLLITVHAPALLITGELQQEVTVLPGQDSDVLHFGIRANLPGLHEVTVRAFRHGTFLGEVRCQISVDPGETTRGGSPHSADLETLAFDPGEVTLQVLRSGPGTFTFQLLSETCYAPETFRAGSPNEAAGRIHFELKEAAAKAGRADAAFLRRRLRAHGAQLWSSAVPEAVQHQFWEQSRRITSFTILGEHDVIPWELLYPVNEGHDRGFLCEWLPVVRRVFGQDRVRELSVSKMAFVVPPGSPTDAGQEVHAVRTRLGPVRADLGVLTKREELTDLLEVGLGGLLHFACHNAFTAAGSQVAMADGPFAPIDLAVAAQLRSLRAEHPLVFFNACRSAGEIDWFGATLGWAPQFLRAGAGAFIGTLWPVRSTSALDFADVFYDQLITHGKPLGQASLAARQAIRGQDGDPTWLAYAVYGSPAATAHTPL